MRINDRYTSFYYESDDDIGTISIYPVKTALLVVDMQNRFAKRGTGDGLGPRERREWERWQPFYDNLERSVIPNLKNVIGVCRNYGIEVNFVRIACHRKDGRDRSLDHKGTGANSLLIPFGSWEGEIIDELKPHADEMVLSKTTDSTLTGTTYRLILQNMGIDTVIVTGVYTDQCVSSTVRSLADESFKVILVEDCCAAATKELHEAELTILNNIYCHVVNSPELVSLIKSQSK